MSNPRKAAKLHTPWAWLVIACAVSCTACGEIGPEPPNVLIYVVSSLRADALGSYDSERLDTPHFDDFASSGVVFENAYSNSSWARPAMASILTGLYPWHHGAKGLDDELPASAPSLAHSFSANGYTSALITANPNVGPLFGFDAGFDESIELYARSQPGRIREYEFSTSSDIVTQVALKWMEERPRPFFLVVLTVDPHAPYLPPRAHDRARYRARSGVDGRIASLNRLAEHRRPEDEARIRELYQAEVATNDAAFGELVAGLRRTGELDRTIVILTSDHGETFWEYGLHGHGNSLSHEVLHVPLAIRYPGEQRLPAGARTEIPISLVDLGTTLLEVAGLPVPSDLDGRSFFASAIGARSPILASLDTPDHTLLASMAGPYKLLWDRGRGELALFDMRVTRPEAHPIDPRQDGAAAVARKELMTALISGLGIWDEPVSAAFPGRVSPEIEADLRALGYGP